MAETYAGEVRDGVVVFEQGMPRPAEGTKVQVAPVNMDEAIQDLSRRLLSIAGILEGLPADFAEQHDHYIHGTPKR